MDLASVKLDAAKITGGVWWALSRNPDGTLAGRPLRGEPGDEPAVLVRPRGVEFERAWEAARRPHLVEIRDKKTTPADDRRMLAEAVAEALWCGAHNLTLHGEPFVWSKPAAARMLAMPEWANLCDFILAVAADRAALLANEESRAAGN